MSANYQTPALVIGASNWGEADKIVTLITPERGQVRAMAFGCRRPQNRMAAAMQMFNRLEAVLSPGQKLDTVRQVTLEHSYRRIGENLTAMAYGSFVAELVREFVPEGEPAADAFVLLEKIFAALEERNPRVVALAAAWQFLRWAGLAPNLVSGNISPSLRQMIEDLYALDFTADNRLKFPKEDFLAAEKILLAYLRQTMDRPLKSLAFIQSLG